MRFDRLAKVIQITETSDGYGGRTATKTELGTIRCIITPYIETTEVKAYGVEHPVRWKIITLDTISADQFEIESDGVYYKVLEDRQYNHNRRTLVCEVDIDG